MKNLRHFIKTNMCHSLEEHFAKDAAKASVAGKDSLNRQLTSSELEQRQKEISMNHLNTATLAELIYRTQQGEDLEIICPLPGTDKSVKDYIWHNRHDLSMSKLGRTFSYRIKEPEVTITRNKLQQVLSKCYDAHKDHESVLFDALAKGLGL